MQTKRIAILAATVLAATTDFLQKNPKFIDNTARVKRYFNTKLNPTIPVNLEQEQRRRLQQLGKRQLPPTMQYCYAVTTIGDYYNEVLDGRTV